MVRTVGEDRNEQQVIDDIAQFGWHCVHILPEAESVGYSFTVGLFHGYKHPELIIFGLSSEVAYQILSTVVDAAKVGEALDLSKPTDALLEGYSCCFAEVPASEYRDHVGYTRWFYQGNAFPLYQVVWPSKAGLFPWHSQASKEFRLAQPIIAHGTRST